LNRTAACGRSRGEGDKDAEVETGMKRMKEILKFETGSIPVE
jgi:hypothetical protein